MKERIAMTRQSIMRYFVVAAVLSWTLSTFAGGKVEVTGDTSHGTVTSKADGAVVTLTVTPQEGYYIRKSDIKATRTFMPTANARSANRNAINSVPIPDDLTLAGNDPDDLSQPRTYTVTLPGEEYDILLDVKYSQKQTVTESMVSLSETVFVYNEQVQRPVVNVQGLIESRDYMVTYSNPTSKEADTYTVTVTGYSTWAGNITRSYKIFRGGKAEVNNSLNGGTIATAVDGLTVTLTVTPNDGYYIRKEDVTLSKTYLPVANNSARSAVKGVPIADGLELIGEDPEDLSLPRTYTAQLPSWEYSAYADAAFSTRETVTSTMVKLSKTSFTYNGIDQKPVVTVSGLTENKDYVLTFQGTSWSDVGTYSLTVTGKSTWKGTVKKTFKINKAMSVVTKVPEAQKLTYNKTALTLISAGDATGGTMMYSTDGTEYLMTLPTATDAGEYTVYYKVAGDSNHNDTQPETITASIGKAEILISGITAENKVYDGTKDVTLQFGNVVFGGIVVGDKLTVTAEGEFADANAGTDKTVNISGMTLGGESLANYSLASEGQQNQTIATIMPRSIDGAQIGDISPQTYTGEPIVPEVSVTLDDVALSADKDYTVAYTDNINVGTAVTTITGQGNYTGSTQTMFTITRAAAGVVTAPESLTLTYNGTAQALLNGGTAEGGSMVYSLDGTSYEETIPTGTDAGDYTVYYKVAGDSNHNDTQPETITASISKAEILISGITAENKVYDGTKDATLQFGNVIFGGIVAGDKLTVTADGEFADANAGTDKLVNISGLTLGGESLSNYILASEGQQNQTVATISKAAASIVISPVSRTLTYDGMAQTLLNAGTAEGGSMIYSLDGDSFEEAIPTGINAGEYTVYYKVDGDCNHNDTEPETITVNIGKVMLTVTAQDKRIFCNEEMPTLTVSYSGFVNNETERRLTVKPVVQTDATPESEAGVYDINVSGGEAVNYDFTYVKGTLTMLIPEFVDDKGKGVEAELVSDGQGKTNAVITELPNSFWEGKSEIPTTVTDIAGEEYEVKEVASEAFDDMSSDLIVVLPEGLSTTEPVTNVVNGDGTCETLDLTDVNNFSLPIDVEVDSVVYVREVKTETTTICLPYDIPAPANVTVFTLKDTDGEGIILEEHTGDLQAFQPYVIKMENSSMARSMVRGITESQPSITLDLSASNVNISHTASEASIQKDQFILCGTVRSLTHKEGYEKKAYIMQPDLSWRMTASSDPEDAEEQYLAPFQAYLIYTGSGEIEDVPTSLITGIETLKEELDSDSGNVTQEWYDLYGRKLPGKPSKAGLYIYQNKKVKL